MTLEQIQNDYAVSEGYKDFNDLLLDSPKRSDLDEIYNDLFYLVQKECLKLASDKFKQDEHGFKEHYTRIITNENNIIK